MLANNVSSSRRGCSRGEALLGMSEIRGVWVGVVVRGGSVVVVWSISDRTWFREGLREESKVIGAIGVVVSSCGAPLSMEESGPGNPDATSSS